MKARWAILLTCLCLPLLLLAQKPPFSATLTNPGSQTLKFDPSKQKIPPLNLSCKLSNGQERPFPCEFRIDRVELYAYGVLLGKVTPVSNAITLPWSKVAGSLKPADAQAISIGAVFTLTRINPSAFPEVNLLLAQENHYASGKLYKPTDSGLAAVSQKALGQSFKTVTTLLVWPVEFKGEKLLQFSTDLYLYLPMIRNKLKETYGATLSLKEQSEASMTIKLKLTTN